MNMAEMQEQAVIITALENRIAVLETALNELRIRVLGYYGPDHPYLPIIAAALEADRG